LLTEICDKPSEDVRRCLDLGGAAVSVLAAIFAPYLAPHSPIDPDLAHIRLPPFFADRGSYDYLLGTDWQGRVSNGRQAFAGVPQLALQSSEWSFFIPPTRRKIRSVRPRGRNIFCLRWLELRQAILFPRAR
jgi:hypothetical protein